MVCARVEHYLRRRLYIIAAMAEVEGQFAGVEVVLRQAETRAFADGRELGTGLLSVEESNLCWSSSDGCERLVLAYPSIAIHAVSRDTSAFPHHCVYLQYMSHRNEEEDGEGEEEGEHIVEIRLVPPAEQLDAIYMAITHCQTLYPDPELSDSEAEEEEEEGEVGEWDGGEGGGGEVVDLQSGEFFTTAEGLDHLSAQGQATLAHLERILQLPSPDQFESMVSNGDEDLPAQFEDAD